MKISELTNAPHRAELEDQAQWLREWDHSTLLNPATRNRSYRRINYTTIFLILSAVTSIMLWIAFHHSKY
jgi:hypothetical protein